MAILEFPPLEYADETGLLAIGGDLEPESLLLAYSQGIFPWPIRDEILAWFSPPARCVLFVQEYRPSRSLRKKFHRGQYRISMNTNFSAVIRACRAAERPGQHSTWITEPMVQAYEELFHRGFAWSVECYAEDRRLVGGVYGVRIHNMWAGESMFHLESDTSKLCLHYLMQHLHEQKIPWLDCQTMTPHIEALGARELERGEFLMLLQKQLKIA